MFIDVCPSCQTNLHEDCHDVIHCACAGNEHRRPHLDQDSNYATAMMDDALFQLLEAAVSLGLMAKGCSTHDTPPMNNEQKAAANNGDDPCTPAYWPIMPDVQQGEDYQMGDLPPHHTGNPGMN